MMGSATNLCYSVIYAHRWLQHLDVAKDCTTDTNTGTDDIFNKMLPYGKYANAYTIAGGRMSNIIHLFLH